MTAFEAAWDLVKMPVVQGSVARDYRSEDEEEDNYHYKGAFDDPETGERMKMRAKFDPQNRLDGWIDSPPDDTYNLPPRATASLTHDYDNDHPKWSAMGLGVDHDYRRRGYATGMYDFLAYILDRHNRDLTPAKDQSGNGYAFWNNAEKDLEEDEKPIQRWRVRGDLG